MNIVQMPGDGAGLDCIVAGGAYHDLVGGKVLEQLWWPWIKRGDSFHRWHWSCEVVRGLMRTVRGMRPAYLT